MLFRQQPTHSGGVLGSDACHLHPLLSSVSEQCEEATDGRPEQEPVPEEAGAAADQGHGGVHVRAHLPAGRVRGQARGAWEPPVCPGR